MILTNSLIKKNLTISTAESITGGSLAYSIIKVSGASKILHESYIVYSNDAKSKVLNIPLSIINEKGAASFEVAFLMASNLYELTKTDICVATTGYACDNDDLYAYVGIHYNMITTVHKITLNNDKSISKDQLKKDNIEKVVQFAHQKIEELIK